MVTTEPWRQGRVASVGPRVQNRPLVGPLQKRLPACVVSLGEGRLSLERRVSMWGAGWSTGRSPLIGRGGLNSLRMESRQGMRIPNQRACVFVPLLSVPNSSTVGAALWSLSVRFGDTSRGRMGGATTTSKERKGTHPFTRLTSTSFVWERIRPVDLFGPRKSALNPGVTHYSRHPSSRVDPSCMQPCP